MPRRKSNPNIKIFEEIYGHRKPKCKGIKKRHKKSPLNALLDVLWSKAVKILANNKCEYCEWLKEQNKK